MLEAELDHGFEITKLAATIVAPAFEGIGDDTFFVEQMRNAVGQLNLASSARGHGAQVMKYARRQDVSPDHGKRRWRRSRFGLLDHAPNAGDVSAGRIGIRFDDPPAAD